MSMTVIINGKEEQREIEGWLEPGWPYPEIFDGEMIDSFEDLLVPIIRKEPGRKKVGWEGRRMKGYTVVSGDPLQFPSFKIYAPDGTELPHVMSFETTANGDDLRKLIITVPLEAIGVYS